MNYTDIMVDIETLDTLPTAAITQIGAVAFNLYGIPGEISKPFTVSVRPNLTERTTSYSTIQFWMRQSDEARTAVFEKEGSTLSSALVDFFHWYKDQGPVIRVWAMPPSFDITILEDAMRAKDIGIPWAYNEPRCVRTLADIAGAKKEDRVVPEIAHDAGYDALAQAQSVLKYFDMIQTRGF